MSKVLTAFIAAQTAAVVGLGFVGMNQSQNIERLTAVVSQIQTSDSVNRKASDMASHAPVVVTADTTQANPSLATKEHLDALRKDLKSDLENAVAQTLETAMLDLLEPPPQEHADALPADVSPSANQARFSQAKNLTRGFISSGSVDNATSEQMTEIWPSLSVAQQDQIILEVVTSVNDGRLTIDRLPPW